MAVAQGQYPEPLVMSYGITIRLDGRTDLHNYYPEAWRRADAQRRGGGATGSYTLKRSRRSLQAVLRAHADLAAERGRSYFVTMTNPPDWSSKQRREGLRRFLDHVRKEPGYLGHVWVTELHGGEYAEYFELGMFTEGAYDAPPSYTKRTRNFGTIHHHVVLRFAGGWVYRTKVARWSAMYCGSSNGLDIKPVAKGAGHKVGAYMGKVVSYMAKSYAGAVLPFRWWGTSAMTRKVRIPYTTPVYLLPTTTSVPGRAMCARVAPCFARAECNRITEVLELERMHRMRWKSIQRRKRKRLYIAPLEQPTSTDEHLQLRLPGGTDHGSGYR